MFTGFIVGLALTGIVMLLGILFTEEELKDAKKKKGIKGTQ